MTRESTRWRGCCWKHPDERVIGVCASCLRERLLALATSEDRYHHRRSLKSSSLTSTASSSNTHGAAVASTIANLMEADHLTYTKSQTSEAQGSETAATLTCSAPALRRSLSWSQSKTNRNLLPSMTPEKKWDNFRMPSPLSAVFPQNSIHPSTADIKPDPKTPSKSSSWLSSLFHWRSRRRNREKEAAPAPSSSNKQHKKQRWFGRKSELSSKDDILKRTVKNAWREGGDMYGENAMSWMSGPLPQSQHLGYGQNDDLPSPGYNQKVIRLSSTGRSEQVRTENLDYLRQSDNNLWGHHQIEHRPSPSKPWATPLRIFSRKSGKGKADSALNSWKLSSEYEHHPSPAHPANYSAFYRDHGALSLYSSPMPAGKYKGRRPLEGRSEMFQSSPYMGSSSWNFYLTPVRPIKSSSKQRP